MTKRALPQLGLLAPALLAAGIVAGSIDTAGLASQVPEARQTEATSGYPLPSHRRTAYRHTGNRSDYFPGPGEQWQRRAPAELGMNAALLDSVAAYSIAHEGSIDRDLRQVLNERSAGQPYSEIIGPIKDRGGPNGIVLRHGYIVAEWGETRRVDMTFSVTKSFLSTTAGLAFDRGLISHVDDRVGDYVKDGGFDSPHNAVITWHHLLQQTSEWEGVLWDKPDVADRRRGRDRELREAGTFWEYNDVRVNRLALSLLRVWQEPLPRVLEVEVMDPIGASGSWEWHGYRNSFVTIDGQRMQSVSGGGHWGGGLWINTRDLARFGYLFLRRGRWKDRQIISERWIEMATTPSIQPTYGYMWWLNTDRELLPSAPETSFAALGGGTNMVWVDPEHDIVAVVRWIDRSHRDGFVALILASVDDGATR